MLSIIQQQQDLEYFPDELLINEVSNPSGRFPGYLVITELERRQEFRDRFKASQQAQEGEQPTIIEQAVGEYASGSPGQGVDDYANGIVSADPNFQNQDSSLMTEMSQPTAQMAGGGKVPRYQVGAGVGKLFVNPLTGKDYTKDDATQVQKWLKERGEKDSWQTQYLGLHDTFESLTQTPIDQMTRPQLNQLFQTWKSADEIKGPGFGEWLERTRTPERPLATGGSARDARLKQYFSNLSGLNIPDVIQYSPEGRRMWRELNGDRAAWIDWGINDPDMSLLIAKDLKIDPGRIGQLGNVAGPPDAAASEDPFGPGQNGQKKTDVQPAVDPLEQIRSNYGRVAEIAEGFGVTPPNTAVLGQLHTDYRTQEQARIKRERDWLEANPRELIDPRVTAHNKRILEDAIRLAEDGSPQLEEYKARLADLKSDENSRTAYRNLLTKGIAGLGTRDEDLIRELRDLKVGEREMTGNINSMGYGALGAAILNIGIDNDKASEALSTGVTDIRKYRRAVKMDNVEVESKLNNLDRQRSQDQRDLTAAIIDADDSLYNATVKAINDRTTEQDRLDVRVSTIGETMLRINNLTREAELGDRRALGDLEQAENALLLNEAEQLQALADAGLDYGVALLTTAYNMVKLGAETREGLAREVRDDIARLGIIMDGLESTLRYGSQADNTEILRKIETVLARLGEIGSGMGGRSLNEQAVGNVGILSGGS